MQWILTIIFVSKKYNILGRSIKLEELNHYKNKISFKHDYFYIYWNIYPIIFYAFFYYIDTSWHTYLNQIIMIGGHEVSIIYEKYFLKVPLLDISYKAPDTIVLIIIIIFAYFATFGTQIKKQVQFIKNTDRLYWWDIRIDKHLYWIRFIFLFFNMILVGFIAYITTKIALFILTLLSVKGLFSINPFHPDLFGGLKVLMEVSAIILAIYLLRAMLGIVGYLDHRGFKDKYQFIGDVYHMAYFIFGILFIIFFIYKMDNILSSIDMKEYLSPERYKMFSIDIYAENTLLANKIGNLTNYYSNLLQFNKFPIDLALFTSSLFTFILPLSLWFIVSFMENRKQEYINAKGYRDEK